MGLFDWPLTVIGQKSSSVKCPYGPRAAGATRPCGGNFWIGGVWGAPDVDNCKYKSERTNKLNNLAKVGCVTCPCRMCLVQAPGLNCNKESTKNRQCGLNVNNNQSVF